LWLCKRKWSEGGGAAELAQRRSVKASPTIAQSIELVSDERSHSWMPATAPRRRNFAVGDAAVMTKVADSERRSAVDHARRGLAAKRANACLLEDRLVANRHRRRRYDHCVYDFRRYRCDTLFRLIVVLEASEALLGRSGRMREHQNHT
jgi:hypothetical protein